MGGQHSLSISDDVVTNMSVNAMFSSSTKCFSAQFGQQNIHVAGGSNEKYNTAWGVALASSDEALNPCLFCRNTLERIREAREQLEKEANLKNSNYTIQTPSDLVKAQIITGLSIDPSDSGVPVIPSGSTKAPVLLGACDAMCIDTIALNITQTQSFKTSETCQVSTQVTNNIQQTMAASITAFLKNQQDIVGQLEGDFSNNSESISTRISSDMAQNISSSFEQSLFLNMKSTQITSIAGNSILANNISQTFTGSQDGTLNVTNTVLNQLKQSTDMSIAQTLLNKNDTTGDLANTFLSVIKTMADLVDNVAGSLLIILGGVVAIVLVIVSSLYLFNKQFHSVVDTYTTQKIGQTRNNTRKNSWFTTNKNYRNK